MEVKSERSGQLNKGAVDRWGETLGRRYVPISEYFLSNYHRLTPGISPTQALMLVHLSKWLNPFPTVATLGKLLGLNERSIRRNLEILEKNKYLKRDYRAKKSTHYDLSPLKEKLEDLFELDQKYEGLKSGDSKGELGNDNL